MDTTPKTSIPASLDAAFGARLHHIGVVTRDRQRVVDQLVAMGAALQPPSPRRQHSLDEQYLGKPTRGADAMSLSKLTLGELLFEVFQPTGIPSPWQDFLDSKGPGIHHVAYQSRDVAASAKKMMDLGATLIGSVSDDNGMRSCYLQQPDLPFVIEFVRDLSSG